MNALQQVLSRSGQPILVCEEGDKELADKHIIVPHAVDCLQGQRPESWGQCYDH
jgi:glucosamine--fructose-6-phosphate aminotransferase (isomerizing)